jgi:predicted GNAT family acetyltransferase
VENRIMNNNPEFGQNPEAQNEQPDLVITELPELSWEDKLAGKKNEDKEATQREYELASEICKKYQKGDQFDFTLEKRGSTFSIILEGAHVGAFTLKNNKDGTKSIGMIMLNENLRGKGFGKQLYTKINSHYHSKDGAVLMSDTMRLSEEAEGLWKSLVKDGLAEETDIETPDGHRVYKFKA